MNNLIPTLNLGDSDPISDALRIGTVLAALGRGNLFLPVESVSGQPGYNLQHLQQQLQQLQQLQQTPQTPQTTQTTQTTQSNQSHQHQLQLLQHNLQYLQRHQISSSQETEKEETNHRHKEQSTGSQVSHDIDATDNENPNGSIQFPWKLHDMLTDADTQGFSHVVSWQHDGKSFRVHKPSEFVESVMPKYFKQTKYKSFQRQLNLYGFTRISDGILKGSCKHKFFIKDQRHLCKHITRSLASEERLGIIISNRQTMDASVSSSSVALKCNGKASRSLRDGSDDSVESGQSLPTHSNQAELGDRASDDGFQFPWKLHSMLERSKMAGFEHIVSWQPGDRSFKVHDTKKFVDEIMPLFFKQTKYKSFQQQLNLYGFTRVLEGPNTGSHFHKFFVRDNRELCKQMVRQPGCDDPKQESTDMGIKAATAKIPKRPALSNGECKTEEPKEENLVEHKKPRLSAATIGAKAGARAEGLDWRLPPKESRSDWIIEILRKQSGSVDKYHVHKAVLLEGSVRSEVLVRTLLRQFIDKSSSTTRIELDDADADFFDVILDRIYSDEHGLGKNLNGATSFQMYNLAKHLEVRHLMELLAEDQCKSMTSSNLVQFLSLGEFVQDQVLFDAAIGRCAEDLCNLDLSSASKIQPNVLLKVLHKNYTLPDSERCSSKRWSQIIAESLESNLTSISDGKTFLDLTCREHLPEIEHKAAIKLLFCDSKYGERIAAVATLSPCLQERCLLSVIRNWTELRTELESDSKLTSMLRMLPSPVLAEILMKTTSSDRSKG